MQLVLYSKPGCHLCEGLHAKLDQVSDPAFNLVVRDITTDPTWFQRYQYEIPVLCWLVEQGNGVIAEVPIPRLSPRASATQVARMLQKSRPQPTAE